MLFRAFLVARFPGTAQAWPQDGTSCTKLPPHLAQNWHKLDHVSDKMPQIGLTNLIWPKMGANESKEEATRAPVAIIYVFTKFFEGPKPDFS